MITIWLDIVLNRRKSGKNSGYQTPTCKQFKKKSLYKMGESKRCFQWPVTWSLVHWRPREMNRKPSVPIHCLKGGTRWGPSDANWVLLLQCPEHFTQIEKAHWENYYLTLCPFTFCLPLRWRPCPGDAAGWTCDLGTFIRCLCVLVSLSVKWGSNPSSRLLCPWQCWHLGSS